MRPMMLAGEASMTVGSLFLKACIIVTALAVKGCHLSCMVY